MIEQRVQGSLVTIRAHARREAEEQLNLKVQEKEQTINSMQKQIADLKRRAEQGSQQRQGEILELELESLLAAKFPFGSILPVRKGERGGDVLQGVVSSQGQKCGSILWETKRTKNWSDGWLAKLRDDQRNAEAEIAVIVSLAMPKDTETFEFIDGVWVTHPRTMIPVACLLRHALMEIETARRSSEGQQTKAEMVYEYLSSARFRQRVQAIIEAFNVHEGRSRQRKAPNHQAVGQAGRADPAGDAGNRRLVWRLAGHRRQEHSRDRWTRTGGFCLRGPADDYYAHCLKFVLFDQPRRAKLSSKAF
jgi:hypothetical protein